MSDSGGLSRPQLRRVDLRRLRESLAAGNLPDSTPLSTAEASLARHARADVSRVGTILTVCTGNICRSPMGEVLLRSGLEGLPIQVHSAGTHALVDHEMTEPAQEIAVERGANAVAASTHRARQLTPEILAESDLVLAMSREHRSFIVQMAPALLHRTFTVREFARLAATLSKDHLRDALTQENHDAPGRLQALARIVGGQRGMVPIALPEADDVIDPYRRSRETYERCADLLTPAVTDVARVVRSASDSANRLSR